jgi:hypothetical protein
MYWRVFRTKSSRPDRGIFPVYVGECEENHGSRCPASTLAEHVPMASQHFLAVNQLDNLSSNIGLVQPEVNRR